MPAVEQEADDVDTWADLRALRESPGGPERGTRPDAPSTGCEVPPRRTNTGSVNLHDWIDELMDALDIEAEIDEGLVLDVARQAAHRVERPAAPISDVPARLRRGLAEGDAEEVEALAGRALALAEKWEGDEDLEAALEEDDRGPRRERAGRPDRRRAAARLPPS